MKDFIKEMEKKTLAGNFITFEETMKLAGIEEKEHILELCNCANNIRQTFMGKEVDLCTIMNAKSGHCT